MNLWNQKLHFKLSWIHIFLVYCACCTAYTVFLYIMRRQQWVLVFHFLLIVPNIFSLDSFSVVKKLCSSTKAINAALLALKKRYLNLNYWQLMILLMKMFKSRRNGFLEKNVCWLTKSYTMKTFTLRTFINKDRSRWNDHIEGNANCNPTTFFKCL